MTSGPVAVGATSRVPQWTFGDHLRKARRFVGQTQAAFAERLGVNAKTYAGWESDAHPPASIVAVARRVELLTQIPASWLLGVADPPPADDIPFPGSPRTPGSGEAAVDGTIRNFSPRERPASPAVAHVA